MIAKPLTGKKEGQVVASPKPDKKAKPGGPKGSAISPSGLKKPEEKKSTKAVEKSAPPSPPKQDDEAKAIEKDEATEQNEAEPEKAAEEAPK